MTPEKAERLSNDLNQLLKEFDRVNDMIGFRIGQFEQLKPYQANLVCGVLSEKIDKLNTLIYENFHKIEKVDE